MITIYSLFWSIINCCLMAFIIFFLRTRTMLISKYGTSVIGFLTVCCIVRILLPVEFPKHQYILADNFLYSWIVKHFKFVLHPDFRDNLLAVLIVIWICGSVFSILRLMKKSREVQKVYAPMPVRTIREQHRYSPLLMKSVRWTSVFVPEFQFRCLPDIFIQPSIFRTIRTPMRK